MKGITTQIRKEVNSRNQNKTKSKYLISDDLSGKLVSKAQTCWNYIFGCSEDYLLQNVWKVSDGWSGGLLPGGQPVNKFWKCVQTSCLLLKIFKPVAFCWKFSNQLPFVKLSEKKRYLRLLFAFCKYIS